MKSELLKQITGYPEYWVSTIGNVYSMKNGRMKKLKPSKNGKGYLKVLLYKNGRPKHLKVHRLVAEAFIPNQNNLPQVNHKDEDKTNNIVSNLEWCTAKYNINYGAHNKRMTKTKSKTVLQLRMDGSLVRIWPSVMEIQRQLGYSQGNIAACCRGERHSAYGFKWCYAF